MRVRRRLPPVMQERDYALLWVALLVMAFATQMTAVAVGASPATFIVGAQREWVRTGLILENGARYLLTWTGGQWRDQDCPPCDPTGQAGWGPVRLLFRFREFAADQIEIAQRSSRLDVVGVQFHRLRHFAEGLAPVLQLECGRT